MSRVYLLVPLVALTAFFAYYAHSLSQSVFRRTAAETAGDLFAGRNGASEARAALSRGKLILFEYGLYLPWDEERREVARKKFGVEYRVIGGCIVTESLVRFATAYNQVMQSEITARFGSDVFDSVNREGKALFEERWPKKNG